MGFSPMRLRGGGGLNTQRTYAMIKPDAVKAGKVDDMQKLIKDAGFKIIKQKKMKLSEEKVNVTHCQIWHGAGENKRRSCWISARTLDLVPA